MTQFFQDRVTHFQRSLNRVTRLNNQYSLFRILVFVSGIAVLLYFANSRSPAYFAAFLGVFTFLFSFLVKKHNRIKYNQQLFRNLREINQQEIQRLKGAFEGLEPADELLDPKHTYAVDLDIFGKYSLFQWLFRGATEEGKFLLGQWLLNPPSVKTLLERQLAVKALKSKIDWRQTFQAKGLLNHAKNRDKQSIDFLFSWIDQDKNIKHELSWKFASWLLPLLNITLLILVILQFASFGFLLLSLFITAGLTYGFYKLNLRLTRELGTTNTVIASYREMLLEIEGEPFNDEPLEKLKSNVVNSEYKASSQLKELEQLTHLFESRTNLIYGLLNALLMLEVHLVFKVEKWKQYNKNHILRLFSTVNEFEALNSLSGMAFANQDMSFPLVKEEAFCFSARQLGHPLINSDKRVNNDFQFDGKEIIILTGSNMSGKSTFLRTIGVNFVLAQMGAPVLAEEMQFSPANLFSSMRTSDNLEESTSSFYAELKRIRQLLDTIDCDKPTLFLLDEILKGTNSIDRNKGAVSLVGQLAGLNTFGLVSTHDLELAKLENDMQHVKNFSFNSRLENDELTFDYRLTEGPCHSFNASILMAKMGINIID